MTTINVKDTNPATKQFKVVARFKATHRRPHGRPRNVRRRQKVRRIA
jgi:hypothetical protein